MESQCSRIMKICAIKNCLGCIITIAPHHVYFMDAIYCPSSTHPLNNYRAIFDTCKSIKDT